MHGALQMRQRLQVNVTPNREDGFIYSPNEWICKRVTLVWGPLILLDIPSQGQA